MIQKLPLFPLNTVLFPGAPLVLHIFEERYKLMVSRCIEQKTPFGVVLIHDGEETGPAIASSFAVGTTAAIARHEPLDNDEKQLVMLGQRRFRVQYALQRVPYLIASVAMLPEETAAGIANDAQALRITYARYLDHMASATGQRVEPEELSADPVMLTYQIAHRLHVSNQTKQRWLEADVATRLRELATLLRNGLALLPKRSVARDFDEWEGLGTWN
ncbi:MAG: LON peptidase substrate-binding domain-containing protein [Chloroflexales bacterium]|nr:LON peptidase substrate-binding domain-containing protein [Chloroflexales bacterium]